MPTYEYECKSCSHGFEVFQSMSDPPIKECPKCGKEVRRLILGGTGVIFKGSGFYVTDKGKGKTESKPASSTAVSKTADAKGDSAPKTETAAAAKDTSEKSGSKTKTA